jgi:DNA-binding protein HU-beta
MEKIPSKVVSKQELIKRVAGYADVPQKQAREVFDATLAAIMEALQAGESVRLVGFGSFTVREVAARTGVHPRTREPMDIPAKERVRFSPGKLLAESVLKS